MYRPIRFFIVAIALVLPSTVVSQQSSAERAAERAREAKERAAERAQERAERARERAEEARERNRSASLDTVVAFDARGTLTVSCPGGAVIVTGSERNEIRVRARTESGAIRFTSSSSRATLEPSSGRGCSDGHFEVIVPVGTRINATTWSGSASVRGVRGAIEVHSQSGDVTVKDAGDRLDIESLSGDVSVTDVVGDATIHTVSGEVNVRGAHSTVEIESISGEITLRDVTSKQVRTHNTSGDVTFQGAILEGGRYELTTHSGEVVLELPSTIGAELSVSTFSGGIESDFPITLKPGAHGIGASQAKRLSFTLGHGSARILAETFSGDITLRRH